MTDEHAGIGIDDAPAYLAALVPAAGRREAEGAFTQARTLYRWAIAIDCRQDAVCAHLAQLADRHGDPAGARRWIGRAVTLNPQDADHHNALADRLDAGGDPAGRVRRKIALALAPDHPRGWIGQGTARRHHDWPGVVAAWRRAAWLAPDLAELRCTLGDAWRRVAGWEAAAVELRLAIAIAPHSPWPMTLIAGLALQRGALEEALRLGRYAVRLSPDNPVTLATLANTLAELIRYADGLPLGRQAIALDPACAPALTATGMLLAPLARTAEAERCLRRAVALNPWDFQAFSALLFTRRYQARLDPAAALAEARAFGARASALAKPFCDWPAPAHPQRLRVGLVSGDMRDHPVGRVLETVLGHTPPSIEIIAYPTSLYTDATTRALRALSAEWSPLEGLADARAAERIRADGVHVLLDVCGHAGRNRLPLFAWRPAPVQASWLGYFATTGMAEIPTLIADPHVVPAGEADQYSERVVHLPDSHLCFTPAPELPAMTKLPALSGAGFTFGSFNSLAKLNDAVVAVWARIVNALPGARLFLRTGALGDARTQSLTMRRFADAGLDPARLIMEGFGTRSAMYDAYARVDVGLDPFPYPGASTTIESLQMGVPVLTRRGDSFLSHVGEMTVIAAGLPDWVARDEDDYVEKALAIADDLPRLSRLRARLRAQVLASPLFDGARYARNLETVLWQLWTDYERSSPGPDAPARL